MINCFKDTIHALMTVLLSTNDDDGHGNDATEEDDHVDGHMNGVREEVDAKEDECQVVCRTLTLRSSLRKADSEKKEKKKVQWVDVMGIKELAEIREFEPSGEDDNDSDGDKNCLCVIL